MSDDVYLKSSLKALATMPKANRESSPIRLPHPFLGSGGISLQSRLGLIALSFKVKRKPRDEGLALINGFLDRHEWKPQRQKAKLARYFHNSLHEEEEDLLYDPAGLEMRSRVFRWADEKDLRESLLMGLDWQILWRTVFDAADQKVEEVRIGATQAEDKLDIEFLREGEWEVHGSLPIENREGLYGAILLASSFEPGWLNEFFEMEVAGDYRYQTFTWVDPGFWRITFGYQLLADLSSLSTLRGQGSKNLFRFVD